MKKIKCECPVLRRVSKDRENQYSPEEKSGMNHKPGKCKGTNKVKKYNRNGIILNLCSCCNTFGDKEIS